MLHSAHGSELKMKLLSLVLIALGFVSVSFTFSHQISVRSSPAEANYLIGQIDLPVRLAGQKYVFDSVFMNESDTEYNFAGVVPSCSCTDSQIHPRQIKPGESFRVFGQVNARKDPGAFKIDLQLVQPEGEPRFVRIVGNAIAPIVLAERQSKSGMSRRVEMRNMTRSSVTAKLEAIRPRIADVDPKESKIDAGESAFIEVIAKEGMLNRSPVEISFKCEGADLEKPIRVVHKCELSDAGISLEPFEVSFGVVRGTATRTLVVRDVPTGYLVRELSDCLGIIVTGPEIGKPLPDSLTVTIDGDVASGSISEVFEIRLSTDETREDVKFLYLPISGFIL